MLGSVHRRDLDSTTRIPTTAQIVADIPVEELPPGFAELGEVRINDELIPRGVWRLVRGLAGGRIAVLR